MPVPVKKPTLRAFYASWKRLHARDPHAAELVVQAIEFLAEPSTCTGYARRVLFRNVRHLDESVGMPAERSLEGALRRRASEVRS